MDIGGTIWSLRLHTQVRPPPRTGPSHRPQAESSTTLPLPPHRHVQFLRELVAPQLLRPPRLRTFSHELVEDPAPLLQLRPHLLRAHFPRPLLRFRRVVELRPRRSGKLRRRTAAPGAAVSGERAEPEQEHSAAGRADDRADLGGSGDGGRGRGCRFRRGGAGGGGLLRRQLFRVEVRRRCGNYLKG